MLYLCLYVCTKVRLSAPRDWNPEPLARVSNRTWQQQQLSSHEQTTWYWWRGWLPLRFRLHTNDKKTKDRATIWRCRCYMGLHPRGIWARDKSRTGNRICPMKKGRSGTGGLGTQSQYPLSGPVTEGITIPDEAMRRLDVAPTMLARRRADALRVWSTGGGIINEIGFVFGYITCGWWIYRNFSFVLLITGKWLIVRKM